jgi:hypothetical protein
VFGDLGVHEGLGHRWVVAFVVTPASVPDQINQEVLAEGSAISDRQTHACDAGNRIIRVEVDDGHLKTLGQIAGVQGRAALVGCGRKAKLIVRDDVQGATRAVASQARQVQCFGDDPLARKGCVTMDEHAERGGFILARAARATPIFI